MSTCVLLHVASDYTCVSCFDGQALFLPLTPFNEPLNSIEIKIASLGKKFVGKISNNLDP